MSSTQFQATSLAPRQHEPSAATRFLSSWKTGLCVQLVAGELVERPTWSCVSGGLGGRCEAELGIHLGVDASPVHWGQAAFLADRRRMLIRPVALMRREPVARVLRI